MQRSLFLLLLAISLAAALVAGISMILDASEYYGQQMSAAMPVPSGKR